MAKTSFPGDRPENYEPDLVFDEDTGTWVTNEDINRLGGGRYRTTIVTVSNYQIFYEELT